MNKLFAVMAIMMLVLGASICFAAPAEAQAAAAAAKESLPIGAKIAIGVFGGCLVSFIIVKAMIASMNTAREATQADNYYTEDDVRVAVSSDRYTHTTRKVTPKQQKN